MGDEKKQSVGEMNVTDFFELMKLVFPSASEKGKERRLGDLTVQEFASVMLEMSDMSRYRIAQQETEVARRVFKDAQLLTAGTPFRVTTHGDVSQLYSNLSAMVDAGQVVVVALAVVPK